MEKWLGGFREKSLIEDAEHVNKRGVGRLGGICGKKKGIFWLRQVELGPRVENRVMIGGKIREMVFAAHAGGGS